MNGLSKLLAVAFVALSLAGCAGNSGDEAPGEDIVDKENFSFSSGLGGIAGLLVDDRFRPIDLESNVGEGEFQSIGFVLVQEQGKQYLTNENGEFQVLNLDPGTYTLRVQAEGHEATPQRVVVRADEFTETSIVARRVSSVGGTIITDEYSAFVTCSLHAVLVSANPECTADQSSDSDRFSIYPDYTGFADLTVLIAELLVNQEAQNGYGFSSFMRLDPEYQDGLNYVYYSDLKIKSGNYGKMTLVKGEVSTDPATRPLAQWNNTFSLQVALFGTGILADESATAYKPVCDVTPTVPTVGKFCVGRGFGAQLGIKGQFLVSAFLGEPELDYTQYCVLCV